MSKKTISVISACFNEEENVVPLCAQVKEVFDRLPEYDYEHIFIDNSSADNTVAVLKKIAAKDKHVKIIVNARNFGIIRSGYYGLLQGKGDAVIPLVSDLQDPPAVIYDFIKEWEKGYKIVIGVKVKSRGNRAMTAVRNIFYSLIASISETEQLKNATGFGLYDKQFFDILRKLDDPYPYFRGFIAEFGLKKIEVPYVQPKREKGVSKSNFYYLYNMAMLGFVNHSKVPLRLASFIGFSVSLLSFLIALAYLIYKLLYWDNFQLGMAPLAIGIFFMGGTQLFFLGIIGEYIGAIFTQVKKHPLVIERERINFD